ncbi:MAG: RsmB/NOP family class I SAM-dependent RNA methyltransferase [Candidatus Woesearchaeota archaeon]
MNQFLERYKKLGMEFNPEEFMNLKNSLRINTLRIDENQLIVRLKKQKVKLEKIPFLENAYWYEAEFSLASSIEYLLGYIYIQETASQIPAQVLLSDLKNKKNVKVLDMCAAPGSKTTQIAQILKDENLVIALDNNSLRLTPLKNNIERLRLKSIVVIKKDARYADDLNLKFSHILLDAPCSGNFCVEKNFFSIRNLEGIKGRAQLQKELLRAAYKCLDDNGILVYSTCSLEPEEDEIVIDEFLKKYPDMKLVDTNLKIGDKGMTEVFDLKLEDSIKLTRKFWPHKTKTEGFFIAKMKKSN